MNRKTLRGQYLAIVFCLAVSSFGFASSVYVQVPGTRVFMAPPADFIKAELFPGFQSVNAASTIMITEIDGPFEKMRAGMAAGGAEAFKSKGMIILSTEETRIASYEGLLIYGTQDAQGTSFYKWIGMFGNQERIVMIVATFPASMMAQLSEPLKQAVLSVRWYPDLQVGLLDGLTFGISETATLRIAGRVLNGVYLTKNGVKELANPSDPFMVVGSSYSESTVEDLEDFSKKRIAMVDNLSETSILQGAKLTIANCPAYELIAYARDKKTRAALIVYQAIVLRKRTYYIALGIVGAALMEKYLPDFQAIAASLTFLD